MFFFIIIQIVIGQGGTGTGTGSVILGMWLSTWTSFTCDGISFTWDGSVLLGTMIL